jgi:lysozyme
MVKIMDFGKVKSQLREDEGVVPYAYKDSLGYLTIGVGRLIDKDKGGRLSEDEIDYLLNNDINKKYNELISKLPWIKDLDEVRQGALLNMSFQMGVEGLLKFKNSLLLIQMKQYQKAASNLMMSLWAKQTPNRAKRVSKQIETGNW